MSLSQLLWNHWKKMNFNKLRKTKGLEEKAKVEWKNQDLVGNPRSGNAGHGGSFVPVWLQPLICFVKWLYDCVLRWIRRWCIRVFLDSRLLKGGLRGAAHRQEEEEEEEELKQSFIRLHEDYLFGGASNRRSFFSGSVLCGRSKETIGGTLRLGFRLLALIADRLMAENPLASSPQIAGGALLCRLLVFWHGIGVRLVTDDDLLKGAI